MAGRKKQRRCPGGTPRSASRAAAFLLPAGWAQERCQPTTRLRKDARANDHQGNQQDRRYQPPHIPEIHRRDRRARGRGSDTISIRRAHRRSAGTGGEEGDPRLHRADRRLAAGHRQGERLLRQARHAGRGGGQAGLVGRDARQSRARFGEDPGTCRATRRPGRRARAATRRDRQGRRPPPGRPSSVPAPQPGSTPARSRTPSSRTSLPSRPPTTSYECHRSLCVGLSPPARARTERRSSRG